LNDAFHVVPVLRTCQITVFIFLFPLLAYPMYLLCPKTL